MKQAVRNIHQSYLGIILLALLFIVVGTIFYKVVEDLDWINAIYFTVITLSTVGYGDITPTTPLGRLFTSFYVFFGIVIFVFLARVILREFSDLLKIKPSKPIKERKRGEVDR